MRTDKFKIIPDAVLLDKRVTKNDLLVYNALLLFKNNKTQKAFPSIATLCKVSRLSEKSVRNGLKHLEELGYIKIARRFDKATNSYTSNVYTLLDASKIDIEPLNEEKGHEKEEEEIVMSKPEPKKLEKKAPIRVEEEVEEMKDNKSMHERALERVARERDEALEKLFSENNCMDFEEFVEGLEEEVEDEYEEWYSQLSEGVKAEYDRIVEEAIVEEGLIHLNTKIENDLGKRLTKKELMSIVNLSPDDYTPILDGIAITKERLASVVDVVSYLKAVVKREVAKNKNKKEVETMEDVVIDDTNKKYDLEEEESKKVEKQSNALDLLLGGTKSSKITY
jgi:hypothetical protein